MFRTGYVGESLHAVAAASANARTNNDRCMGIPFESESRMPIAAEWLDRWMQCTRDSFRLRSPAVPPRGGRRSVRFVASATSVSSRGSSVQRGENRIELFLLGGVELRGVDRDVADRLLAQAKLSALLALL